MIVNKATYSHAHGDHESNRRANDFAMTGILITFTYQYCLKHQGEGMHTFRIGSK